MVNGNTWPFLTVQKRRYRFRVLNGCQSRFLILDFHQIPGVQVWQIGNEGGFVAAPVNLASHKSRLLMSPAERADLIVDFTNVPVGSHILRNAGPDEPFSGGAPGTDFEPADAASTGQILQFRVIPAVEPDPTTPPAFLTLPPVASLPPTTLTRRLAMIEEMSRNFGDAPAEALLGVVDGNPNSGSGMWMKKMWMDPVTENPAVGATETWELYNTTADAHPMHIHEVKFVVLNRQTIAVNADTGIVSVVPGTEVPPEPWETGFKDTVVAYPGQVTRIRMQFDTPGQYVWHCHIVEHEDNEMMRPYRVGPMQSGQPG